MSVPWVLAVDLGTSGLKVGAVGIDGAVLGFHHCDVETDFRSDGGVEQDPDNWWTGVVDAARRLVDEGTVDPAALRAVGITGQYASTVPVDSDGRPTGPCLVWADDRGGPWSAKAFGGIAAGYKPAAVAQWLRYTGGAPSPGGADPSGHALFLKHARPDVYRATALLLEPVDYLGLRFTGRAAATPASMVASWLTDNRRGARLGYVAGLLRRAGRDADRLPPLLPTGSVLGGISPQAADELGLPLGIPVACGVPDIHAAYVASGAVADYAAHVTIGTTSWVSCAVPAKKTDILHQIASVPGLTPDRYLLINNHETAGVCLQWIRDGVLAHRAGVGPEWTPDYDELITLASLSEPGAGGVLFTPWLKGERSPVDDRRLRAAFVNVSIDTDRTDLVRAVLEGVAFNLRWLVEYADKFTKHRLDPLRIFGGGARSDLWCQIHADILDRRIERVAEPDRAQLRGAALYALLSAGEIALADVPALVPIDRVFVPDPATRTTYDPMYREFVKLYKQLKGTSHRLARR